MQCCAVLADKKPATPLSKKAIPEAKGVHRLRQNLIRINGGWFQMGADDGPHPEDGEGPERNVYLDDFLISPTCVTNQEFSLFKEATNYKTTAEQTGQSFVFHLFDKTRSDEVIQGQHAPWWHWIKGACWHTPEGLGSCYKDKLNHPVTHISHMDAQAYCYWAGLRLPTESEWEYAARGGLIASPYPWGFHLYDGAVHRANLWQGSFPSTNSGEDGFIGTAPVDSYDANGFGLYNVTGNVWEWTADRHTRLHSPRPAKNPKGPLNGNNFVAKGGSYLCHESYCFRYRTSSRQALPSQTTTGNIGFRVAADSNLRNTDTSPTAVQ